MFKIFKTITNYINYLINKKKEEKRLLLRFDELLHQQLLMFEGHDYDKTDLMLKDIIFILYKNFNCHKTKEHMDKIMQMLTPEDFLVKCTLNSYINEYNRISNIDKTE